MNQKEFNEVIIRQTDRCKSMLVAKGAEYAPRAVKNTAVDRLAHFKKAAVVLNTTPKAALMGMLSKHLISVSDMCIDEQQYSKEQWDEKITDSINYFLILCAIVEEELNEVKYMSASLQYSDYSGVEDFVIPYDLMGTGQEEGYLRQCSMAMKNYQEMIRSGVDNDSAGYCAPQGMRNILLISATPYQWKHMIRQRTCRRNTKETRYVMLKIWEQLLEQNRELFSDCGPFCMNGGCEEGKMTCGKSIPP